MDGPCHKEGRAACGRGGSRPASDTLHHKEALSGTGLTPLPLARVFAQFGPRSPGDAAPITPPSSRSSGGVAHNANATVNDEWEATLTPRRCSGPSRFSLGAVGNSQAALLGNKVFLCFFCASGVIWLLVAHGLLQERIMSVPYDGEYFQVSVALVLCNRMVGLFFAFIMIFVTKEDARHQAPLWKYLAISFSNVGASACQYEALRYVAFPVQIVAKSFKMMPVMLWGVALNGKKYTWRDWMHALTVTAGVSQFLVTGNVQSDHQEANSAYGLILLVAFLALDGFTASFQEKLFKEHDMSTYNQMLYVNLGSAAAALLSLILSGNLPRSITFLVAHPSLGQDALLLSTVAAGAQCFIYAQVKEFGALMLAMTLNVRQVLSILLSYLAYGHSITMLQVVGLMLVFGAMFRENATKIWNRACAHQGAGSRKFAYVSVEPAPRQETEPGTPTKEVRLSRCHNAQIQLL